jgi:hypothetical protein
MHHEINTKAEIKIFFIKCFIKFLTTDNQHLIQCKLSLKMIDIKS